MAKYSYLNVIIFGENEVTSGLYDIIKAILEPIKKGKGLKEYYIQVHYGDAPETE